MASQMIIVSKTLGGTTEKARRVIEKNGQTFKAGTPVEVDTGTGGIKEWAAVVGTDLLAGFSTEDAQNLATTGLSAPSGLAPYLGVGSALTYGSVPYQASAKNIARGGPVQDGRVSFVPANPAIIFEAQVGPAQTTALTDLTVNYGLTKDSDGHWYVDKTKTGANAVVTVQELHPLDVAGATAGRVLFSVMPASVGISG